MSRSCLLIHELTLPADAAALARHAWSLAEVLAKGGDAVTLLQTGAAGEEERGRAREAARRIGAGYRHLDEFPAPFARPILPAIPAHRTGLQVAAAVAALSAETLWVLDHAAHAAATAVARACGLTAAPGRLVVVLDSPAEFHREAASIFPTAGRTDIAADFLERRAVAGADEIVCSSEALLAWVRAAGWKLPPEAVVRPLLTGGETTAPVFARWTQAPTRTFPARGREPETEAGTPPAPPSNAPAPPLSVSVCVPYYEQPLHLGPALEMIAGQSQPPHEVIVVDDGSKSPAARAAFAEAERRFAQPGWKFLRQENAGPAAARNRGAREAGGQALLFCDADNRFHPDMIATLARALRTTGADCVTCAFEAFREAADPAAAADPGYVFFPLGACVELGLVENIFGDTNFIVRREVFQAQGGFPTENRAASEDWQFLLRLVLNRGSLETVPAVLFDYRLAAMSHARRNPELASARAALAPALAGVDPAWRRLWPHLAGIVRDPRLPHLEAELATAQLLRDGAQRELAALRLAYASMERESAQMEEAYGRAQRDFAETKRSFAQIERDWQHRDRVRRANLFLLERSQRTLGERLQEAAAQRRRDAVAIEKLSREAAGLEAERRQRDDKIARMQRSFSWRATAPLRSLRRLLLDRHPDKATAEVRRSSTSEGGGGPAPAGERHFHRHLDAPRHWSRQNPAMTIRGWCFCEETGLQAVRARIGGRTYPGTYGLDRPDLLSVYAAWPQCARSGFKIEAAIFPDDDAVILEVSDADGQWRRFLERGLDPAGAAAAAGSYEHWVQAYDQLTPGDLAALSSAAPVSGPLVSVLMPVFNPAEKWLARAIESVRAQVYPHWELCLADDASTAPHVRPLLERAAREEPRIKLIFRETNGHISAATNSALALATGDYTALFDHDDELAPHALHCVALEIAAHPDAELIYTDEDKIDEHGSRFDPHFKPDWNPDLLLGQNYISHLAVYRTETLRAAGGLREGFEGSQDWDLLLRVSERIPAGGIRHIPRVLYHWRAGDGSTSLHLGEKSYVTEAARRTLAEHFARRGLAVELRPTVGGHWRVVHPLPPEPPLVSIIIPTRNAAALVQVCLASILARTRYQPYEILLVNNRSDDPAALALFAELAREDGVRLLDYDAPFNYSAINNRAAREAQGKVLCLLNNDIEVLDPGWLDELVSQALRPGIGAVGARLYYPDFRLQHAGVITGLGGVAGHAFKDFAREEPGTPQFRPHLAHNVSAVTAACLAIRRTLYFEAGGFDEDHLTVAFNDVDFCLKVEALGYRNLYTPFAELLHHESASRGSENTPEKVRRFQGEIAAIQRRWGDRLRRDPAYNPNLSLDSEDFALAHPPRVPSLRRTNYSPPEAPAENLPPGGSPSTSEAGPRPDGPDSHS